MSFNIFFCFHYVLCDTYCSLALKIFNFILLRVLKSNEKEVEEAVNVLQNELQLNNDWYNYVSCSLQFFLLHFHSSNCTSFE